MTRFLRRLRLRVVDSYNGQSSYIFRPASPYRAGRLPGSGFYFGNFFVSDCAFAVGELTRNAHPVLTLEAFAAPLDKKGLASRSNRRARKLADAEAKSTWPTGGLLQPISGLGNSGGRAEGSAAARGFTQ